MELDTIGSRGDLVGVALHHIGNQTICRLILRQGDAAQAKGLQRFLLVLLQPIRKQLGIR